MVCFPVTQHSHILSASLSFPWPPPQVALPMHLANKAWISSCLLRGTTIVSHFPFTPFASKSQGFFSLVFLAVTSCQLRLLPLPPTTAVAQPQFALCFPMQTGEELPPVLDKATKHHNLMQDDQLFPSRVVSRPSWYPTQQQSFSCALSASPEID